MFKLYKIYTPKFIYQNPPICRKHNIMKTWENYNKKIQNTLIKIMYISMYVCMHIYVFVYAFMSPVN